jgi:hypothetical protein
MAHGWYSVYPSVEKIVTKVNKSFIIKKNPLKHRKNGITNMKKMCNHDNQH